MRRTVATEAQVWEALSRVTDPEYPLSVVDLGMIYGLSVDKRIARLQITFTSIGCPAIDMILSDIRTAVLTVPGVEHVQVDVVWSPPWTKDRISSQGRRVLRLHGVAN